MRKSKTEENPRQYRKRRSLEVPAHRQRMRNWNKFGLAERQREGEREREREREREERGIDFRLEEKSRGCQKTPNQAGRCEILLFKSISNYKCKMHEIKLISA